MSEEQYNQHPIPTATSIGAQPLDSDLTAIAALSTTAYGRAFLALADAAALKTLVDAAAVVAASATGAAGSVPATGLPTGTMFNLKQTVKTDTFSSNSTSYADVTGLSVAITPTSASNKVLIRAVITCSTNAGAVAGFQLVRTSTAIGIGAAASNRTQIGSGIYTAVGSTLGTVVLEFLDSPATASAVTYKVQAIANASANIYVNRSDTDTDTSAFHRGASMITAIEVKV